jgi:hypothetical protein
MMIADCWLFGLSCSTANTHSPKAAGADAWETSGQGIQFVPQKEPIKLPGKPAGTITATTEKTTEKATEQAASAATTASPIS